MKEGERKMGNKDKEDLISNFVARHPHGTWIEEVADKLHMSRTTASRYLTSLEATGRVTVKQEGTMKRIYPPHGNDEEIEKTEVSN
jgi:predicted transcriptional regulator